MIRAAASTQPFDGSHTDPNMDSDNDSDITGLYGRCPHCNWSIKAKSGEDTVSCESCKKSVNILNGQFVAPGATSPPPASPLNQTKSSIGCLVVVAILVILAIICMSGRSNNSPDYTPVSTAAVGPTRPRAPTRATTRAIGRAQRACLRIQMKLLRSVATLLQRPNTKNAFKEPLHP